MDRYTPRTNNKRNQGMLRQEGSLFRSENVDATLIVKDLLTVFHGTRKGRSISCHQGSILATNSKTLWGRLHLWNQRNLSARVLILLVEGRPLIAPVRPRNRHFSMKQTKSKKFSPRAALRARSGRAERPGSHRKPQNKPRAWMASALTWIQPWQDPVCSIFRGTF